MYNALFAFLQSGTLPFAPLAQRSKATGAAIKPISVSSPANLFDYMLGAGPEKKAQAALFPFLLNAFPSTQREFHVRGACDDGCRRSIDFAIQEPGWDLPVFIEIKHYSPHQGSFAKLLGPAGQKNFTLHGDFYKCRPAGYLIQVALFTGVDAFLPLPRANYLANRFINTYVKAAMPSTTYDSAARTAVQNWHLLPFYTNPGAPLSAADFQVGPPHFAMGGRILGRVNFLLGLVTSPTGESCKKVLSR